MIMKKITKEQAEQAIKDWKAAKIKEAEIKGVLSDAEAVVEAYSVNNIGEFADGRLAMDSGIIALRAGMAKPVKEGKALSTTARAELAAALPPAYVKTTCDFGLLYSAQDKTVRQILQSRGIEVLREDKYTIL